VAGIMADYIDNSSNPARQKHGGNMKTGLPALSSTPDGELD
jgi:hypothetical protein